jgi:hypothetical protein
MRKLLTATLAGMVLGCPAPPLGSKEWVVNTYSVALLESNIPVMRSLVAEGIYIQDSAPNEATRLLHVIRACDRGHDDSNNAYRYTVLIGGELTEIVNGIDLLVIKQGDLWRVKDARLSVDSYGSPVAYLRNCKIDPRYEH